METNDYTIEASANLKTNCMKSKIAEQFLYGKVNSSNFTVQAVEMAEKEIELSRDNLAIWAFCMSCGENTCAGRTLLKEDNFAWKCRYNGCEKKQHFVSLIEMN